MAVKVEEDVEKDLDWVLPVRFVVGGVIQWAGSFNL